MNKSPAAALTQAPVAERGVRSRLLVNGSRTMPCMPSLLLGATRTLESACLGFEVEAKATIRETFGRACEGIHDECGTVFPRRDPDRKPTSARSG